MSEITIPLPFLVTIDDVGWWNGLDGSARNQPFRTGMPRNHLPEDYQALAALGKALNMRIPAGLVLCEWDGTNRLRQLPSATWMGEQWQVPFINPAHKEEAAHIIKGAADHIEPALHGIGHEFWIKGRMDRSEFHNGSGRMRRPDEVKKHLDFFFRLMEDNGLDPEIRLFIPPALNHGFGDGEKGFQGIASAFGIRFVTLSFKRAGCRIPPQFGDVGWECGVALMERGEAPVPWNRIAPDPEFTPSQAILPLHWTNILHQDPQKNMDVVNAWVKAIDHHIKQNNQVPARDIVQFFTQYLHSTRSRIRKSGNRVEIDMGWIHKLPGHTLGDAVFFKTGTVSNLSIRGGQIRPSSCQRETGLIKVSLPRSGKIICEFSHPE